MIIIELCKRNVELRREVLDALLANSKKASEKSYYAGAIAALEWVQKGTWDFPKGSK